MESESTLVGHAVNQGKKDDPEQVFHMKKIFSHKKSHSWGSANTQIAHVGVGAEVEWEAGIVKVVKGKTTAKFDTFWEGAWTHDKMDTREDTVRTALYIPLASDSQVAGKC
jgi:hypothetical protein